MAANDGTGNSGSDTGIEIPISINSNDSNHDANNNDYHCINNHKDNKSCGNQHSNHNNHNSNDGSRT